jgi:hypothetical protein
MAFLPMELNGVTYEAVRCPDWEVQQIKADGREDKRYAMIYSIDDEKVRAVLLLDKDGAMVLRDFLNEYLSRE